MLIADTRGHHLDVREDVVELVTQWRDLARLDVCNEPPQFQHLLVDDEPANARGQSRQQPHDHAHRRHDPEQEVRCVQIDHRVSLTLRRPASLCSASGDLVQGPPPFIGRGTRFFDRTANVRQFPYEIVQLRLDLRAQPTAGLR